MTLSISNDRMVSPRKNNRIKLCLASIFRSTEERIHLFEAPIFNIGFFIYREFILSILPILLFSFFNEGGSR